MIQKQFVPVAKICAYFGHSIIKLKLIANIKIKLSINVQLPVTSLTKQSLIFFSFFAIVRMIMPVKFFRVIYCYYFPVLVMSWIKHIDYSYSIQDQ